MWTIFLQKKSALLKQRDKHQLEHTTFVFINFPIEKTIDFQMLSQRGILNGFQ